MEIIPGILEKEWDEIEKKLEIIKPFAKTVHIDLLDGKFVDNTTFFDPAPFKKYADRFYFELHMMVEEPIQYLQPWANAGIKRFLGHVERMSDQAAFVAQGQLLGEVGLAIDGPTSSDAITVSVEDLDMVLFYVADRVGFSGKPLQPDRLEKVQNFHKKHPFVPLGADGGIKEETIRQAKHAGISRFVATSAIYTSSHPQEAFTTLKSLITSEN